MADSIDLAGEPLQDLAAPAPAPAALPNSTDEHNAMTTMDTTVTSGGGTPEKTSPMANSSPSTPQSGVSKSPQSVTSPINKSPHAHSRYTDPTRLRERQERVRMVREKQAEERKRKLAEMQDAQRRAQEFRERQQEERRRKIQEMRRRDQERRSVVEERRKKALEKENERRKEILKKFQEKENKVDSSKNKRLSGVVGFGSRAPRAILTEPMDSSKRAASHSSLLRKSGNNLDSPDSDKALPHRRAVSACSLTRNRGSPADKHVLGSISEKSGHHSFIAQKTPPPRRPRSRQSDKTGEESPAHRRRPHSVAGRTSSYATPTTASDKRQSRSTEKKPKADVNSPKIRSKSADTNRRRIDIEKSMNRLSQPRTPKESSQKTAPSHSPSKPLHREPIIKSRETPKHRDSTKPSDAASPQIKSSPSRQTPKRVQIQITTTAEPPQKSRSSPPKESASNENTPKKAAVDKNRRETLPDRFKSKEEKTKDEKEGENAKSLEEEYKAKLAEKRRQAKEKAEREAEAEKQRKEELRLAEEERIRREEEEQRRMEEEALRLAEEARKAEEERLRQAIQAEEIRKQEEAERLLAEQKAKEEAEERAREEAERREQELQERAKRQEEERSERKKRLEMIMKRVKVNSPETVQKTDSSPVASKNSSPPQILSPEEKPAEVESAPKFKSPLLQSLLGRKSTPTPTIKVTSESTESAEGSSDEVAELTAKSVSDELEQAAVSTTDPVNNNQIGAADSVAIETTSESDLVVAADDTTTVAAMVDTAAEVLVETATEETVVEEPVAASSATVDQNTGDVSDFMGLSEKTATDENGSDNLLTTNTKASFDPFATIEEDIESPYLMSSSQNHHHADFQIRTNDIDPKADISEKPCDVSDDSESNKLIQLNEESSNEVSDTLVDVTVTSGVTDTLVDFTPKDTEKLDEDKDVDTSIPSSSNVDLFDKMFGKQVDRSDEEDNIVMSDSAHQNYSHPVNGHASLEAQQTLSTDSESPQSADEQPRPDKAVTDSSFEQLIDLSVANKNVDLQSTTGLLTANEADLINSNSIEVEPPTSPLIAFEDNSTKITDPQGMPS